MPFRILLVGLLFCVAGCALESGGEMKSDEQEIRELFDSWIRATTEGDLGLARRCIADDALFLVPVDHASLEGGRRRHRERRDRWRGPFGYEVQARLQLALQPCAGQAPGPFDGWVRWPRCRRSESRWKRSSRTRRAHR